MKIKHLLYCILLTFPFFSCINDPGNYDYLSSEEVMPITISGFEDTVMVIGEELVIKPVIKNMDDESRYEYLWYASKSSTQGYPPPTRDTLSQSRDLSVTIRMAAEEYRLVYIIRNLVTDVYARKEVILTVQGSEIGSGWYVLKEINNETDFDYINPDKELMIPDVLRTRASRQDFVDVDPIVGELQLKGKPVKIVYQDQRYNHQRYREDGTAVIPSLSGQKVLHVMSDQEMKTINAQDIYLFKDMDEVFYELPATVQPQNIIFESFMTDLYMINGGKIYGINGFTPNLGKFGYQKINESNPNYRLHSDMVAGMNGAMVFDTSTSSFLYASSFGASVSAMSDPPNAVLPRSKVKDYSLVRMLERSYYSFPVVMRSGFALFREKADPSQYYVAYFSNYMGTDGNPFTSFRKVPDGAQLPTAEVLAVPGSTSSIYFAKGNVLNVYIDAADGGNESVVHTFPSDEEIGFVGQPKSDLLTVLTNSSNGWRLYGFKFKGSTWEIENEPEFTYPANGYGEGRGHSVILR